MNDEIVEHVRQAIDDAAPHDLSTQQARAAVQAMIEAGYVEAHGEEYAVKRGDVLLGQGFNTKEQAVAWVRASLGLEEDEALPADLELVRRAVGVWEPAE